MLSHTHTHTHTHTHSPVALSHLLSFPLLCTTQDGMTNGLSLQTYITSWLPTVESMSWHSSDWLVRQALATATYSSYGVQGLYCPFWYV